jgi:phosphopantetheinyl transferase (holo-ACP synthase)
MKAVWLAPPADMGRPVWRDVLEQAQLGPAERAEHLALGGSEHVRSRRLWGRIAAKEAVRRIWRAEGRGPVYPADLAIITDESGRTVLARFDDLSDRMLPSIAIAEADGVALAVAVREPGARPGIAVAPIPHRPDGLAESAFTSGERALLSRWAGPALLEWAARFQCAREAAIAAAGTGSATGPQAGEVVRADESSGAVHVRLDATSAKPLRVATARRGEYAWALTLREGAES